MSIDIFLAVALPEGRVDAEAGHRAVDDDLRAVLTADSLRPAIPSHWVDGDLAERLGRDHELEDRIYDEFGDLREHLERQLGRDPGTSEVHDWMDADPDRRELRWALAAEAAHFYIDSLVLALESARSTRRQHLQIFGHGDGVLLTIGSDYDDMLMNVFDVAWAELPKLAAACGVLVPEMILERLHR